jgi:DnaJ like chaperone protein
MQWVGKAVGAALGFAVAGPVGSVFGVLLGHQFDQGLMRPRSAGSTQRLFFEMTFEIMGHLAKVDGRVSEQEIRAARRIMHGMQLSPEQVRVAINQFNIGKDSAYPLEERLSALSAAVGPRRDLARAFVEVQMQAAVGSGEILKAKRQRLWQIASGLGIGRVEIAQIEASLRSRGSTALAETMSLEAAHRALGVEARASDEEVKTAYRRLMNQHHPDKLVSRGLPESMVGMAEQKTHEIRAAYERIKAHRGFK